MEFIIAGAVAGMGFLFSKNNTNARFTDVDFVANVPANEKPSGENIYESKRSQKVWNDQQQLANRVFAKSKNSSQTNYMIAGPPVPIFNKVDETENKLPVEFLGAEALKSQSNKIINELDKKIYQPNIDPKVNDLEIPTLYKDYAAAGGWDGISLTGNPVDRQSFYHNNMVPFFGGTVKQNLDDNVNKTILENFTGNAENYQQKKEVERNDFFKPVANLSNPYGMSNLEGYNRDRYIVGNIRNNQSPVEPIRVGPGLNNGYTAEPSGGFQQANKRDFELPKTVDELRTKNNPKVSYQGVVIPGKHIAKPGKVGVVAKNNPDTFYVNSPDRLFTAVGDTTGPTQRPTQVLKYTNRKTTELKSRVGPAAPAATGSQTQLKPGFKKSTKFTYKGAGPRNTHAQGQWGIEGPNAAIPNDYGRSAIKNKPNARMITGTKQQVSNYSAPNKINMSPEKPNIKHTRKTNVQGNNRYGNFQNTGPHKPTVYDPNDKPRTTIKETNIDNNHQGYFQNTGPTKGLAYDPNDVLRTTTKETNIDNNHEGFFQNTGPNKPTVYDPNDVLRTTTKETMIDNNHEGYFQNTGPMKPTVYDPNDVMRTTTKQTTIDNSHQGYFQNTGPQKPTVYDPNDVLRTTTKQTTIDNNHQGYFQNTGPEKGMVYDPNNIARTTVKQTTIDNNRVGGIRGNNKGMVYDPNNIPKSTIKQTTMVRNNMGNMDRQSKGGAYVNKQMKAKDTQRITTSVHYVGDATGPSRGGYTETQVNPKNTSRQFMSDNEVKGNAGPASVVAPKSYQDIYNATIKTVREDVAVGREPAKQGPKGGVGAETLNMKTTRTGEEDNIRIGERGVMSTKVYNSIPQPNQFGETHYKDTLPNKPIGVDRIEPSILDAFRKNPYTQSLHSFAFN